MANQRLAQVSGHLNNAHGRDLLSGEVSVKSEASEGGKSYAPCISIGCITIVHSYSLFSIPLPRAPLYLQTSFLFVDNDLLHKSMLVSLPI